MSTATKNSQHFNANKKKQQQIITLNQDGLQITRIIANIVIIPVFLILPLERHSSQDDTSITMPNTKNAQAACH